MSIPAPRWSLATRVAFRFFVAYFTPYILLTQMLWSLVQLPGIDDLTELDERWPTRQIVSWTATHVFHAASPLVITGSGSGDKTFDWVEAFCLLMLAIVVTIVWSVADRRRPHYASLHKWFRVFLRFALGSTMFTYGFAKAIPLQMPYPSLVRLVEPFGNLSPMGVLWASIGASRSYEIFIGCSEILGGLLVMIPRTALLGALVCLADTIQVFVLNMTYDVPVKLFSFHLVLMALFLLAPDAPRLVNLFFRNREAGPSTQPPLFQTRRANRLVAAAQWLVIAYLAVVSVVSGRRAWTEYGGGAPVSPLYGIWNVSQLSVDGQPRPLLVTDADRWRRVLFTSPTRVTFQRMDDTTSSFGAAIDTSTRAISLTRSDDKNWKAAFTFQRPGPESLILDGSMDQRTIHMELQLVDREKFLLVSRGFHWIQEYPFNR